MNLRTHVPVLLAVVVGGCALGSKLVPEAQGEFKATGSILGVNLGASFNSARVISPNINLAEHDDGSWSGQFSLGGGSGPQKALDVSVTNDAIRGVGFVLVRKVEKGKTVLDGAFDGKTFHFEVGEDAVVIHTSRHEGVYGGRTVDGGSVICGEGSHLTLTGDAAKLPMLWPQMGLALVAAFY